METANCTSMAPIPAAMITARSSGAGMLTPVAPANQAPSGLMFPEAASQMPPAIAPAARTARIHFLAYFTIASTPRFFGCKKVSEVG